MCLQIDLALHWQGPKGQCQESIEIYNLWTNIGHGTTDHVILKDGQDQSTDLYITATRN